MRIRTQYTSYTHNYWLSLISNLPSETGVYNAPEPNKRNPNKITIGATLIHVLIYVALVQRQMLKIRCDQLTLEWHAYKVFTF
jgi:hypothetical protein